MEVSIMRDHNENNVVQNKSVIKRLSIMIGQLEGIKRMSQEGRDCGEILVQMAAVKSALNSTAKVILEGHINHCVEEAIEKKDKKAIEDLNSALRKFLQ
jgi:DNA-binding FrmR family transcriptional regulator